MDYKTIKQHIDENGYIHYAFSRFENVIEDYKQHRVEVLEKKNFRNLGEYLKIDALNYEEATDAEGKKYAKKGPKTYERNIVLNNYPYKEYVQTTKHHLLWAHEPVPNEEIEQYAKELANGKEYIWFINLPVNKSVPELWHAHILVNDI